MMEIIQSTFLQYIPLSVEIIFIFIAAEAGVLLTFTFSTSLFSVFISVF